MQHNRYIYPPHLRTVVVPWEINQEHNDTRKLRTLGLLLHSLKHNKFNCTAKRVQVRLLQKMFEMSSFLLPRELCSRVICNGRVSIRLSVCLSVCLSQVGVLLKWLNTGKRKQCHTIAQAVSYTHLTLPTNREV